MMRKSVVFLQESVQYRKLIFLINKKSVFTWKLVLQDRISAEIENQYYVCLLAWCEIAGERVADVSLQTGGRGREKT